MEDTRNSNAFEAGDTSMTDVLSSPQSLQGEDEMSLHRVKKSLNVSLPSEHLFPELTSLVPVLLDSEEEESANLVDEEIIKSHIISAGDKDVLLSSSKGNKSKISGFFGQLFSKKRYSEKEKEIGK
ncbi:uncharacterized protein LOC130054526 [Ostrea edulis]|uniref:uncharacterized protein LOC130054526 n=1 Tax=Ostrea edulis TaxID=37623 RepID=UPI0024AF762A|nr:uncharacterized protein LOC130054526 [Ostrea edulis]